MDLSYEDVQRILKIIDGSSVDELHLEIGDFKLVVRKHGAGTAASEFRPLTTDGSPASTAPRPATPREGTPQPQEPAPVVHRPRAAGVEVKAPMVGTFYRSPAPGAPPFVEVGSAVDEDGTVCIIEVMKLMNSIRAGCRGRVIEICVDNGVLVQFGQTLMVIEPLP
jgi:acetyl-CoA carboxylase biotin carboxyl carrier protein